MDDNPFRANPFRRSAPAAPPTIGQAVARGAATSFADSALGLPDLAVTGSNRMAADILMPRRGQAGPLEAVSALLKAATGGRMDPVASAEAIRARQAPVGSRVLGLPRGEDVVSALTGTSGEEYARQRPVATQVGEVAGDAATLLTGRIPFTRAAAVAERSLAGLRAAGRAESLTHDITGVMTSAPMKALYKGLGRTAETSLEGATMAMLKEGDPLETAAYGAMDQAVGSAALGGTKFLFRGGPLSMGAKLGLTALATGALFQTGKELTPGGRNRILESTETGFEHVAHGLLLGGLSAMAGAGRLRGEGTSRVVQHFADAVTSMPRGAILGLLSDLTKEDEVGGSDVQRTVAHLSTDPDVFNATQQKQLSAGLEAGEFASTVKSMIAKDPRFAAILRIDPAEELRRTGAAIQSNYLNQY